MSMSFNLGLLMGIAFSAAFTSWVVGDCQSKGDYCVVSYAPSWERGVLRFAPMNVSPTPKAPEGEAR